LESILPEPSLENLKDKRKPGTRERGEKTVHQPQKGPPPKKANKDDRVPILIVLRKKMRGLLGGK